MAIELTHRGGAIALSVKVVPGASRDAIAGEYGGGIKITVSQTAQRGAANRAVLNLLAETLGISKANIEIGRGLTSPRKQVLIRGIGADEIRRRLAGSFAAEPTPEPKQRGAER